jgi:hypothetical protein
MNQLDPIRCFLQLLLANVDLADKLRPGPRALRLAVVCAYGGSTSQHLLAQHPAYLTLSKRCAQVDYGQRKPLGTLQQILTHMKILLQTACSEYSESVFSLQPLAFSLQPLAFNLQPSAFSLRPSTFDLQPLSL